MGEVSTINFDEKYIKLNGSVIAYDYLVLAVGGRTNFFGFDAIEKDGFQLKDLETAVKTRNHLLGMFEQASHEGDAEKRKALLTFVIVGGGPTGVETAGALAELISHVMVKDYPSLILSDARVVLLEAGANLISSYPDELRKATSKLLKKKNVDVRLNTKLESYNGQHVTLADGSYIETHTLIWTAGVKATEIVEGLNVEKASAGRVRILPTLQLPQHPETFVIGDAAFLEENGQALPMISTVAIQQGVFAAKNIRCLMDNKPLEFISLQRPWSACHHWTQRSCGANLRHLLQRIHRLGDLGLSAHLSHYRLSQPHYCDVQLGMGLFLL